MKALPAVLMVVSEALPYAKTGGLGDVGGALPAALARLGCAVTVVTPRYRRVDGGDQVVSFDAGSWPGAPDVRVVQRTHEDGVRVWLVDCPALFDREGIYGDAAGDYPDNDRRFAVLSRAGLETAARLGWRPSVVHAHDWQTGLVPAYLKYRYQNNPTLAGVATVFTIHNLAYQGLFAAQSLPALDLGWESFTGDGLEFWRQVSFLKSGINFSDVVTTVSGRYAQEIQTAEYGCGFEGVLQQRSGVLVGIPNGIDTAAWNPASDPWLPASYTARDPSGKAAVKQVLLERCGIKGADQPARPVVGMVSRMVDQKGLDLIEAAVSDLMHLDATFVILGTGLPHYEQMWRKLQAQHPDRVSVTVGFSEEMAHLIEGGADIFLMPSRFEPCGLNQMYSLRYGTVPVVRATGGLDDTVQQADAATGKGTGFKFKEYSPHAMLAALEAAVDAFGHRDVWRKIQVAGMKEDHSWDRSAREYVKIYQRAGLKPTPGK
ncbi:MAG: glycogen synthase GlgA [Acidobacteria bacterium]|nr:glycogen synthase GlgA [Acidobacteriota bacterium]